MENPLCISTGLVYRLAEDINERIEMLKNFNPDGIELNFAFSSYFMESELTSDSLSYLQSLKFNSIHLPWKEISYDNSEECRNLLKKAQSLYAKIGARNVVVHCWSEEMIGYDTFNGFNFSISIENDDWRGGLDSMDRVEKFLDRHPSFGFTLDFAHVLTIDENQIPIYLEKLGSRLKEFHVSYLKPDMKDHGFLHKNDTPKIRGLLKLLDNKNIPIVLECVAKDKSEVEYVKEEMTYLKSI